MRGGSPSHPEPFLRLTGMYRSVPASKKGFLLSLESTPETRCRENWAFLVLVFKEQLFFFFFKA